MTETRTATRDVNGCADGSAATVPVAKALRRITHAIDIRSRAVARGAGLTIPQLVVLQSVRDLGEVTTSALSAQCDLTLATVVAILDKLEDKKLVERYRSTIDRRVVHTRLTAAGSEKLRHAPPLLAEEFVATFVRLPAAEQQAITRALQRVAAMMAAKPFGGEALDG